MISTALIDQLYNLISEESVRLADIKEAKELVEESLSEVKKEIKDLIKTNKELTKKLDVLKTKGPAFLKLISDNLTEEKYGDLVGYYIEEGFDLGLSFDKLIYFSEVQLGLIQKTEKNKIDTIKQLQLKGTKEQELNEELKAIDQKITEEISKQAQLKEYHEQALNEDLIKNTREELETFLEWFGFTEEECAALAKLFLFPKDALIKYHNDKFNSGKGIGEVIEAAKEAAEEVDIEEQITSNTSELEDEFTMEINVPNNSLLSSGVGGNDGMNTVIGTTIGGAEGPAKIEKVVSLLKSFEINPDNISPEEIEILTADYDSAVANMEYFLQELNKGAKDIELTPLVLAVEDVRDIDEEIKRGGFSLKDLALKIIEDEEKRNKFLANVKFLQENGIIDLDGKVQKAIGKSPYTLMLNEEIEIKNIINVLTLYKFPINKDNGIFQLFYEKMDGIVNSLDVLVEKEPQVEMKDAKKLKEYRVNKDAKDDNNNIVKTILNNNEALEYLENVYSKGEIDYFNHNDNEELQKKCETLIASCTTLTVGEGPLTIGINGQFVSILKLKRNLKALIPVQYKLKLTDEGLLYVASAFNSLKTIDEHKRLAEGTGLIKPDVAEEQNLKSEGDLEVMAL